MVAVQSILQELADTQSGPSLPPGRMHTVRNIAASLRRLLHVLDPLPGSQAKQAGSREQALAGSMEEADEVLMVSLRVSLVATLWLCWSNLVESGRVNPSSVSSPVPIAQA